MPQFMETAEGKTLTLKEIAETAVRAALPRGGTAADFTDGIFVQGAADAILKMMFHHRIDANDAAKAICEVVRELGFTGKYLVFGYSHGNGDVKIEDGTVFTGPYLEMRTRDGELHVLPIGIDPEKTDYIDGYAG